jgi:hypothetical protein
MSINNGDFLDLPENYSGAKVNLRTVLQLIVIRETVVAREASYPLQDICLCR